MPRRLRALQDFSPAPGSLFEIPLKLNEVVELIEDGDAPDGWLLVQSGRRLTGLVGTQGLVLTFLEEMRRRRTSGVRCRGNGGAGSRRARGGQRRRGGRPSRPVGTAAPGAARA